MNILYAILGAYLVYQLQKQLYKKYWMKHLSVNIRISDDHAIEGEDRSLIETIVNHKLLPLPIIRVKFMASKYLVFYDMSNATVTDHYYRNDLFSVLMYQKHTRNISFHCSRRGYYSIDKIFVVCSDLLLEKEHVLELSNNTHLYVYPRPVDYNRIRIPFQKMLGTVLSKRFIIEDPFEFKNIREYQTYDTLRMINWKASAKTGTLMVNVFDHTASQQIKILLNLEIKKIPNFEELLEESIRIAATLSELFTEQGIPTELCSNGADIITGDMISISAGSGQHHVTSINEALARINLDAETPTFLPIIQEVLQNPHPNEYIVIISAAYSKDLQESMVSLADNQQDFRWFLPRYPSDKLPIKAELEPYVTLWDITLNR